VFDFFKTKQKRYKRLALDDTRAHIEPYDAKSLVTPQSLDFQLTSQSSDRSPWGHKNLPHQLQYSGMSTHKYNPQAKLEPQKLNKTDPST
jgi:hypothetical protein